MLNLYSFLSGRDCPWFQENMKFAEYRRSHGGWDGRLTSMQEEVLQSDAFMDVQKNIVIQGATSSGKTLLAEIAALRQIVDREIDEYKVLFLVPLRALVAAQSRQFQRDFEDITLHGRKLRIYESSADYQDHDEEILNGQYEIAVIVYEKFFAMLNNERKMLENCGLVIVDELQMLGTQERGPKMEFAIMKILEAQQKEQSIRIIGLTTSATDVQKLCEWMNAERLGNSNRPVGLKQFFISYDARSLGNWKRKDILSEEKQNPSPSNSDAYNQNNAGPFEGTMNNLPEEPRAANMQSDYYQKQILFAVFDHLSMEKEKAGIKKILLFVNTKRKALAFAKEIVRKYFMFEPKKADDARKSSEFDELLQEAMLEFGDEDDVKELNKLIPYGVAFHHSGLPFMVREAIEDSFRSENGQVKMIVCTETLMIGMNMPTDIVILYDSEVYRGESEPRKLSLQEYQNFIGRAGRLGFSKTGISILLTGKPQKDFHYYTSDNDVAVQSPFPSDNLSVIAPFFMSWIGEETDASDRIQKGLALEFRYAKDTEEKRKELSSNILQKLMGSVDFNIDGVSASVIRKNGNHQFILSRLGGEIAPYALTLNTNKMLAEYIAKHRKEMKIENLQFEFDHEEEAVPPRQLLELLYALCQCSEMSSNPALRGIGDKTDRILNDAVQNYLKKIYQENIEENEDAAIENGENRTLYQIAYSISIAESEELRGAMRAILLALWMAGCPMQVIRERVKFNISIGTSDVERLSETIAYLMEALGKCGAVLGMRDEDAKGLSDLATSMKYGVPYALVPLANLRVRNITRPFLLRIGKDAKEAGKRPKDYVLSQTSPRYTMLQKALRDRERVPSYTQQLANKSSELRGELRNILPVLRELESSSRQSREHVQNSLLKTFTEIMEFSEAGNWQIEAEEANGMIKLSFYSGDGKGRQIYLKVVRMEIGEESKWTCQINQLQEWIKKEENKTTFPTTGIIVLCGAPLEDEEGSDKNLLVISSEMLGILLLTCLLENDKNVVEFLYRILSDIKGDFVLGGNSFFNEYGKIWPLVKGYAVPQMPEDEKRPQLFYFPGVFDYRNSLISDTDRKYAEVPWGTVASNAQTVVFYHPAMEYSRTAKERIRQSILLCDEESMSEVQKFEPRIVLSSQGQEMDQRLTSVAQHLKEDSEQNKYEYDVGISFRSTYEKEMKQLEKELSSKHKKVLCMNTNDFEAKMAGRDFATALTGEFRKCRHIIACDTKDYDESPYTFLEYNVIIDKLIQALKAHRDFPIYRVQMPGVGPSEKLSNYFRHSFNSTYRPKEVSKLADELIKQMEKVENGYIVE